MRRHRLDAVHARNHVPAAMALIVQASQRLPADLRPARPDGRGVRRRRHAGSAADCPYRLTRPDPARRDRAGRRHRDAHRGRATPPLRRGLDGGTRLAVIPCCADLAGSNGSRRAAATSSAASSASATRPVMVYVGKFTRLVHGAGDGGLLRRGAQAAAIPTLLFLVLTQADQSRSRDASCARARHRRRGLPRRRARSRRRSARYLAAADFGISFIRPLLLEDLVVAHEDRRVPRRRPAGRLDARHRRRRPAARGSERRRARGRLQPARLRRRGAGGPARCANDPDCRARCRAVAREQLSLERRRRPALRPALPRGRRGHEDIIGSASGPWAPTSPSFRVRTRIPSAELSPHTASRCATSRC